MPPSQTHAEIYKRGESLADGDRVDVGGAAVFDLGTVEGDFYVVYVCV